jgi:MOSC domain-containing protein YiiM
MPCFKLGIRFDRADMVKRFLHSGRTGFYFAVLEEGDVAAGDPIDLVAQDGNRITVSDVVRLYTEDGADRDLLRRAAELSALPDSWREYFRERLGKPNE